MNQKYIYLIFSKTGTWLSRSISLCTSIKYPHVSLCMDGNFNKIYSFGRKNVNNPFSGGLVTESFYNGVYKKFTNSRCIIYKIPVTDIQITLLKKQIDNHFYINDLSPYKYNFIGLFLLLANIPLKRQNRYFCSQFISEILNESSIWTSPKSHELIKPTDIMQINNKEFIYKGLIRNFFN